MKKKIIFTFLLLFSFCISLNAQYTFQKILSNPDDQVINCITEDDNGNFILVGQKHSIELGITQAYLIRLNTSGELLDEMVLDSTLGSSIFFNAFFFNDSLFLLGTKIIEYPSISKLFYLKLDKNLVKTEEKYLGIPSNRWFSYMNSIIDSDSNFVITGYTTRYDTVSLINNDVFFYKLSLAGDSIYSYFNTTNYSLSMSFNIIEKSDQSGYFAYGRGYTSLLALDGQRFELTKEFDSINIVIIPHFIDSYISSEKLNDSILIISGGGAGVEIPSYSLCVLTTTMDNDPIDFNHYKIEGDMRDYPALFCGLSINGNNIYLAGTSNFDYSNPSWSTLDSWFHLIKINPNLTPIWENWYGGDAYYFLYSILATSDSGCLMVGNRYDYETQGQERDIYVVKVNSEGLIVWTQEIQPDKPLFTVFPNPGKDVINIRIPKGEFDFELFGLNGQLVLNEQVDIQASTINIEPLPAGMYIYKITNTRNKSFQTGKWVKK